MAIVETLIAVPLYWIIAVKFETYLPLLIAAAVAPLVLLRSDKSVSLGTKWFTEWALATRRSLDREPRARIPVSPVTLTAILVATVITYLLATHFLPGLKNERAMAAAFSIGWLALTLAIAVVVAGAQAVGGEAAISAVVAGAIAVASTGAVTLVGAGASAESVWGFIFGILSGCASAALAVSGAPAVMFAIAIGLALLAGATAGTSSVVRATLTLVVPLFSLFASPVILGFSLGVFLASLIVRIGATLRYLVVGLRSLPDNFRRLVLCISPRQEPELVPGLAMHVTGYTLIDLLGEFRNKISTGDFSERAYSVLFYVPMIIIWFAPAWLYRITLKSTAWLWWPLAYLAGPLSRAYDPDEFQRTTVGSLWAKTSIVLALITICGFIIANIIFTGAFLESNPLITVLGYAFIIDWSAVFPYQIITLVLAGLSVFIVYAVDDAAGQHRHAVSKNDKTLLSRSETKFRLLERIVRVRLILFILLNLSVACQTVFNVNSLKCWFDVPANIGIWVHWVYGDHFARTHCLKIDATQL